MALPVPASFEEAHLPTPWVPESLAGQVSQVGEALFGTRSDIPGVYNLFPLAEEAAAGETPDYVLYGEGGRGMQSNSICYLLVHEHLALFLEQAFGNVYTDADADAAAIRTQWALADDLRAEMERHSWAPEERLIVLASDMTGTQWARLPGAMDTLALRSFEGWQSLEQTTASLQPVLEWLAAQEQS
jgi:hypothetical protein